MGGSLIFQNCLIIFLCTLAVWYGKHHWDRRRLYMMAKQKPGPISLPFIGGAWCFINKNILDASVGLQERYGSITSVWIGQELNFFLSDPEDLEMVLTSPHAYGKHVNYKFVKGILGDGLITAPVDKWKTRRRALAPTFNQKILDGFVQTFVRQSETLVKKLETIVGKGTFDSFDYISRCTLDIIFETEMGLSINAQHTEGQMLEWANSAFKIAIIRMFSKWYSNDFLFNMSLMSEVFRESKRRLEEFTQAIVDRQLEAYRKNVAQEYLGDEPKFKTFLQLLIELSEDTLHLTKTEIREEVMTFFIAGSETTATTTAFTLLTLGIDLTVQEKVYQEIMDVLGSDRNIVYQDLPKFVYLERVLKETLRLFPGGPLLGRSVTSDIKLKGCTIPGGSFLTLVVHHMHRNPEIYPEPLKFDPDRFLSEQVSKRHPYAWLPFSGGHRNCIGMKYAFMVMKTVIANIVREFKITTPYRDVGEIALESQVVLKTPDGYPISLQKRD
ncbi:hypothetical protein RI129_013157 [Pyrocoelia pectoralis]|uniref:Cytochrome P450 n=1 Tax=Pyrocoelia pectoralis TaxID=417401 RepID=A0AAN7UZW5_9COLE